VSDTDANQAQAVVLETALFEDRKTLGAALQSLDIPATHHRKLDPDIMTDSDWDDILALVLSTKRVITL